MSTLSTSASSSTSYVVIRGDADERRVLRETNDLPQAFNSRINFDPTPQTWAALITRRGQKRGVWLCQDTSAQSLGRIGPTATAILGSTPIVVH